MFEREFLCLSRTCFDDTGSRTRLGVILPSGDLDLDPRYAANAQPIIGGVNVVCRCGMPRAFHVPPWKEVKVGWRMKKAS